SFLTPRSYASVPTMTANTRTRIRMSQNETVLNIAHLLEESLLLLLAPAVRRATQPPSGLVLQEVVHVEFVAPEVVHARLRVRAAGERHFAVPALEWRPAALAVALGEHACRHPLRGQERVYGRLPGRAHRRVVLGVELALLRALLAEDDLDRLAV